MENFLRKENLNFFGVCDTNENVLSRFVIGGNYKELDSYLYQCRKEMSNSSDNFDLIYLGSNQNLLKLDDKMRFDDFTTSKSVVETLNELVVYAESCKKLIQKSKCKSLIEYNTKYRIKNFCRTIIFVPNLDGLLKDGEAQAIKNHIIKLLKLEKFSGVSVVVCSCCENYQTIDFKFINSFLNRILFRTENERVVSDVSLGMYSSTDRLGYNQYYYFDYGYSNGKMLSV